MTSLAQQVEDNRQQRDAARSAFDSRLRALKADVEERGIAGRIIDETLEQAKGVFDEAVMTVEEHPVAVAGTLAALMLWFLRTPILGWTERFLGLAADVQEDSEGERD